MSLEVLNILIPLLSLVAPVLAAFTAWQMVYHLIRFFQIEEYKTNRYLAVVWRLPDERRFLLLAAIAVLIVLIMRGLLPSLLMDAAAVGLVIAVTSVILAAALLALRPASKDVRRVFSPTQRARRVLYAAYALVTLPALIVALTMVSNRDSSPVQLAFSAGLVATLTVLLVPLAKPLANLLMFPIEENSRQYYLRLARQNLERSKATVIALTGSYGKTSTKHYLQHILEGQFRSVMTPRSYNTLMGICRAVNDQLAGNATYDYFIVEAGAYVPGEIARICALVKPQISIVITVGPMHLERFGTLDNIVKAKYEIIEALPPDGVGVFNADDPRVLGMAQRGYPNQRILVTREGVQGARLAASEIEMVAEGTRFTVRDTATREDTPMFMPLYGEHNVSNVLLAIATACHVGMSLDVIRHRVATLKPAEHRLVRTVLPNGIILIDDAYSANPVGTQMALKVLALQGSPRRVVVSSGMFELGALHNEANRKLGERIAEVATDAILIGEAQIQPVKQGLINKQFPPDRLFVVTSLNEAIAIYQGILMPGDTLLLLTDLPDTYR
jgi:UDP-N-acetylmuramoyl-tripeptide--D-alanyl-D-alanine ligase